MTSISSVSSAASAALLLKPQAPTTATTASTASPAPTVGSSSAAKVPPAIAALSLRGGDSDGDNDGH